MTDWFSAVTRHKSIRRAWFLLFQPGHYGAAAAGVDAMWLLGPQNSISAMRDATPEERAVWGLPEGNWEAALCGIQGVDPNVYLKLIRVNPDDAKSPDPPGPQ